MVQIIKAITGTGGMCLLLLFGAVPASAAPVWTITETSCTPQTPTSCKKDDQSPVGLPLDLGFATGTGAYLNGPLGKFSESGDFSVVIAGFSFSSLSPQYCLSGFLACEVDIDITATDNGVTGHFTFVSNNDDYFIRLVFTGLTFGGTYSTDAVLEGCGSFANCDIAGVLSSPAVDAPIPEPPSLPQMLAGLALLAAARLLSHKGLAH